MKNFIYIFLSLIFLQTSFLFGIINSQPNEYNIVPLLKKIEDGKISEVKVEAEILLNKFPDDPSIIFLNAILNENGEDALKNFNSFSTTFLNRIMQTHQCSERTLITTRLELTKERVNC